MRPGLLTFWRRSGRVKQNQPGQRATYFGRGRNLYLPAPPSTYLCQRGRGAGGLTGRHAQIPQLVGGMADLWNKVTKISQKKNPAVHSMKTMFAAVSEQSGPSGC